MAAIDGFLTHSPLSEYTISKKRDRVEGEGPELPETNFINDRETYTDWKV